MRKLYMILFVCAMPVSNLLFAQTFGVKGGINLSQQRYRIEGQSADDDSDARLAYHFGLLYEQQTGSRTGFMVELLYSAEGASGDGGQGIMKLNYLNIPAFYYYEWPSGLRIYAGAMVGYLLNVRTNSQGFAADRRDAYENFVLSAAAGAEYKFYRGWRTGLRYSRGISDFLNRDFYTFDLRSHTDTFQLYVVYTFRFL